MSLEPSTIGRGPLKPVVLDYLIEMFHYKFTTNGVHIQVIEHTAKAWPQEHASKNMDPGVFWHYVALLA